VVALVLFGVRAAHKRAPVPSSVDSPLCPQSSVTQGKRSFRKMQSTGQLVGCTEVSGCRRADSPLDNSDAYHLRVSEKKREEYCRAIPQIRRPSRPSWSIRLSGRSALRRDGTRAEGEWCQGAARRLRFHQAPSWGASARFL